MKLKQMMWSDNHWIAVVLSMFTLADSANLSGCRLNLTGIGDILVACYRQMHAEKIVGMMNAPGSQWQEKDSHNSWVAWRHSRF